MSQESHLLRGHVFSPQFVQYSWHMRVLSLATWPWPHGEEDCQKGCSQQNHPWDFLHFSKKPIL